MDLENHFKRFLFGFELVQVFDYLQSTTCSTNCTSDVIADTEHLKAFRNPAVKE